MSRADFVARLKSGLRGLSPEASAEILADYESYFAEGAQAGRAEEELTRGLGDPSRLAAELRLDFDVRRWQEDRSARSAIRMVAGVLGLGALDLLLLAPLGVAVIGCVLGLVFALGVVLFGGYLLVTGPFDAPVGGPAAAILRGVSFIAAGLAGAAASSLLALGLAHALAWHARAHRVLLRPLSPRRVAAGGCAS
jgi:uncharacterized membrane protein